ncbi:MAG: hypothetical protein AB9866_28005 [Syntrophobacteraceae bacterium]
MQVINDLFTVMTLVKMGAVVLIVVSLSILAEVVSPRIAGILTGYPLGAAIALFFMGFEIDPQFAAQSALHTSAGVAATVIFGYCYYRMSLHAGKLSVGLQIFLSCLAGLSGYFAAVSLLSFLPSSLLLAVVLPALTILISSRLQKGIRNVRIGKRVSMSPGLLLVRAVIAAITVVFIISSAKLVGPTWAGLFSAFPNIMLPLVVIIHFTYNPEQAYVIIKNVPKGLVSVIIYCLTVSLSYPVYGIYIGTALAYTNATLYLLVTQFGKDLLRRI